MPRVQEGGSPGPVAKRPADRRVFFGAVHDGRVIAFSSDYVIDRTIDRVVYVRETAARQGVRSALLRRVKPTHSRPAPRAFRLTPRWQVRTSTKPTVSSRRVTGKLCSQPGVRSPACSCAKDLKAVVTFPCWRWHMASAA